MLKLSSLLGSYLRSWKANPGIQIATLVVLSLSFTVVITVSTLTLNLERILTSWGESAQLTVYLEDGLEQSKIKEIGKSLKGVDGFESPVFIDKKTAYEEFSQQMTKHAPDILSEENYDSILPMSFRLTLEDKANISVLATAAEKIGSWLGVEEVSYGQEWVSRYSAIMNGFRNWGWIVNLTVAFSILFIIGNSIRIIIAQRRDEIEILELVGATNSVIRLPFIFEGALSGFIAGAISLAANAAFVAVQKQIATQVFSFWNLSSSFQNLSVINSILFLFFSALAGALGSYLCVRKINTGWAASGRLGG